MPVSTLFHAIHLQSELNPQPVGIQSEAISITYANLEDLLLQMGGFLRSNLIGQEDSVLIILPQGIQMALTCLGVMRHSICVPINPDYTTNEIEQVVDSVQPKLIFTNETLRPTVQACSNLPKECSIINAEVDSSLKWDFEEGLNSGDSNATTPEFPSSKDVALLLLTSGSTSTPKMVPLTHENILVSTQNLVASLNLTKDDRCLNMMTMFHVGGLLDLLIAPLTIGCTVMCSEQMGSASFFKHFNSFKPTWYQCVPTMLADIVNYFEHHKDEIQTNGSFRFIRSVSSSISKELLLKAENLFQVPVIEIYGMTETAGVIASNPLPPGPRKLNSVGVVVKAAEVKIIDSHNNPLGPNKVGEILVSGDSVFSGYMNNHALNDGLFVGKWFRTGDTGLIDEDGYLFLKGRVKEIINRGGEKISPMEIDRIIESHPAVLEAAAFSVPHPTLGEDVAAAVVSASGQSLSKEELIGYLSESLSQFKLPRTIHFLDKLPRNSGGKIQRHLLTQSFSGGVTDRSEIDDAPSTPLEKLVAELWKKILEVENVKRHDDFFDLGGDSLRALLFISELENSIKTKVDPKVIYEHSVLIDLTQYLEVEGLCVTTKSDETSEADLHNELSRLMAHWPGSRLNEQGLIVGRNTLGTKTPIFWCTNGVDYFEEQIEFFEADQPLYGMVSLIESKFRSVENNEKAAKLYAQEVRQLFPQQEVIIGGWCEGAKIVIDVARFVKEMGGEVKLLFMQDNFIPKPYDGPVALFYSNHGVHRFRGHYNNPDFGVGKYYTGGFRNYFDDIEHTDFYQNKAYMAQFADRLRFAIGEVQDQTENDGQNSFQLLEKGDCSARIELTRPPVFLKRGEERTIEVEVQNTSNITWQPSNESGILLMITSLDAVYRTVNKDAYPLKQPLKPGEKIKLTVSLRPFGENPSRKVYFIQIDLVDDGIARFPTYGSKAIRFPTITSPLMLFPVFVFNGADKLSWLEKIIGYQRLKPESLPILMTNLTVKTLRKFRDLTFNLTE